MTDLAAAMAAGPAAALEELLRAHQDRIFTFALGLSGNREDAEEIASDAFCRAYDALCRFEPERLRELRQSAWLHRIALNVFRNRVRRRRLPAAALTGAEAGRGEGPEEGALRREREAELRRLLASLPPAQRAAVVMRHVQGFGYGEIAEVLGRSEATVRANAHRGLAALRQALQAQEVRG